MSSLLKALPDYLLNVINPIQWVLSTAIAALSGYMFLPINANGTGGIIPIISGIISRRANCCNTIT